MTRRPPSYNLSFSTFPLLKQETCLVAEKLVQGETWAQIEEDVLARNLFMRPAYSSASRVLAAVKSRLKVLSEDEIHFLIDGSDTDISALLWIALCRLCPFVADWSRDVIREKFLLHATTINVDDFYVFLRRQSDCHEFLERMNQARVNKMRCTLFQSMREAGIVDVQSRLIPMFPSDRFLALFASVERREELLFLPVSLGFIKSSLQSLNP